MYSHIYTESFNKKAKYVYIYISKYKYFCCENTKNLNKKMLKKIHSYYFEHFEIYGIIVETFDTFDTEKSRVLNKGACHHT